MFIELEREVMLAMWGTAGPEEAVTLVETSGALQCA
jgi:hypothetical protein